jgi:hypothetical protein
MLEAQCLTRIPFVWFTLETHLGWAPMSVEPGPPHEAPPPSDDEPIGSALDDGPLFWAMVDADTRRLATFQAKQQLATRTRNALLRMGCRTFGDARRCTEAGTLVGIGHEGESVLRRALGMAPLPDQVRRARNTEASADRLRRAGWTVIPP